MSVELEKAIIIAVTRLFITMPWALAGAFGFYSRRKKSGKVITFSLAFIAVFVLAGNVCCKLFVSADKYYFYDQLLHYTVQVLIAGLFLLCYEFTLPATIYIICLLYSSSTMVNQLSYMIANILEKGAVSIASSMAYRYLLIALSLLFAYFIYRFCRRMLGEVFRLTKRKELWQIAVVPLLFFVMFQIVQVVLLQFNGNPVIIPLLTLLSAAVVFTHVMSVQVVLSSTKAAQIKAESEETRRLLSMQEKAYQQLLENTDKVRRLKHDMRFHMSVIEKFAKNGNTEGILQYLESDSSDILDESLIYTKNPSIDAVLNHYISQIQALGHTVEDKIELPAKTCVSDFDLCVLLGNLLENAFNSLKQQEKPGFVKINCTESAGRIVITIDNSLPQSFARFEPGTGLSSVAAIAAKYGGSLKTEPQDGIFKVSAILHNNTETA